MAKSLCNRTRYDPKCSALLHGPFFTSAASRRVNGRATRQRTLDKPARLPEVLPHLLSTGHPLHRTALGSIGGGGGDEHMQASSTGPGVMAEGSGPRVARVHS